MFLHAEFNVQSDLCLDDYWEIEDEDAKYVFDVNEQGRICKLTIKLKHSVDLPFIEDINNKKTIKFPSSLSLAQNVIRMRAIEINDASAVLSMLGYVDISEEPKFLFIPEDNQESEKLKIYDFKRSLSQSEPKIVPFDSLARTIFFSRDAHKVKMQLGFYKNARKSLELQNYRYAFYDLFLTIESMFGGGKSNPDKLLAEFVKHAILQNAFAFAKSDFISLNQGQQSILYENLQKIDTTEELIRHFIKVRGDHFHQNEGRKNSWSPNDENLLRDESIFMIIVADYVLQTRLNYYDNEHYKKEYNHSNNITGIKKKFTALVHYSQGGIEKRNKINMDFPTHTFSTTSLHLLASELEKQFKNYDISTLDYTIFFENKKIYGKKEFDEYEKRFDMAIPLPATN